MRRDEGVRLPSAETTDTRDDGLPVRENYQRGDVACGTAGRRERILIDVQLGHREAIRVLLGGDLDHRSDHAAWATPARPIVHEHGVRWVKHLFAKGLVRHGLESEPIDCALWIGNVRAAGRIAHRVGFIYFATCVAPDYLRRHASPTHPSELAQHRSVTHFSPRTGETVE